ncbi:MAG: hypothetical protein ABIX01_02475 [Chitinophagaceae bacterium]
MEVTTNGEEVIFKLKMSTPELAAEMQRTFDYARVLELSATSKKIPQEEVDKLADDIKRDWWENNKSRFIK